MKLIVEDYKYKADSVQPILKDIINEPRTQNGFVAVCGIKLPQNLSQHLHFNQI